MRPITRFVADIVLRCPAIDSVWLMEPQEADEQAAGALKIVVFADRPTAARLRTATDLHRDNTSLRVVVDGDRFEVAWGSSEGPGSLMSLDWRKTDTDEALYNDASWDGPAEQGEVRRVRRRAICVWPAAAAGS